MSQLVSTAATLLKRSAFNLYLFHRLVFDVKPGKWRDFLVKHLDELIREADLAAALNWAMRA